MGGWGAEAGWWWGWRPRDGDGLGYKRLNPLRINLSCRLLRPSEIRMEPSLLGRDVKAGAGCGSALAHSRCPLCFYLFKWKGNGPNVTGSRFLSFVLLCGMVYACGVTGRAGREIM